jgi:membrane dipeptidase
LAACLLASHLTGCTPSPDLTEEDIVAMARDIHERVITVDTHDDIPFDFATPDVDPGVSGERQVDLPKMRAGGLDVAFFIVYVGQTPRTPENYERAKRDAMTKFDAIHRMADTLYPDQIEIAYSANDVERIHAAGKLVAAIGIENGYVLGRDLTLVERYHALGARYITLAHGGHNDIADSATPRENLGDAEEEHGGLSEFGEQVVAEMNRVGIMVDVSHISKKAALHAMRVSRAPVIASHSSTRAIADHPRNMDDETLLALRDNGGVMQTVALGSYVKVRPEFAAARAALWQEMGISGFRDLQNLSEAQRAELDGRMAALEEQWPPASVSDFVDHIDHAVSLIGIDHVGISSDFDGGGGIEGWGDASESLNVTIELVRRGYTENQIRKLWGGNLLRVWREVERVAEEMQAS